jgi:TPR repeat protein
MTYPRSSTALLRSLAGSLVVSTWLAGAALLQPAQADYLAAEAALKANDLPRAIPLLAEEAKLGNPVAAYNLGKIYENGGDGVPQNYAQAIAWYKLAADVGTLPTQFDGKALGPDAADLIFASQLYAQYNLGRLYEAGKGTQQDVAAAVQWYQRAGQQDLDVAQQRLVHIFREGEGAVAPNPVESTKWLERLAQGGNVPAMSDLGTAYLQGIGVEKNAKIAHDWYLRGASRGSGEALFNLGLLYQSGYAGDPDFKRAAEYYMRAANANSGRAMMALGDLYANAQGVSRSMSQALAWYELAADRGVAEAVAKRDSLTRSLPESDVDQANTIAAAWQPQPDLTPLPEAVPPLPSAPQQPSLLPGSPAAQPAPDQSGQPGIPDVLPTLQNTGLPGAPGSAPAGTTPDATPPANQPVQLPTAPDATNPPTAPAPAPAATPAAPVDNSAPTDNSSVPNGTPEPGAKPFDGGATNQPAASPAAPAASAPAAPAAPADAAPATTDNNGVQLIGTPQPGAKPFGADAKKAAPQKLTLPGTPAPANPAPAAPATPDASQSNGTTNP